MPKQRILRGCSNLPVTPIRDAVTQANRRNVLRVAASDGERVALTAFLTYTVLAGGNAVGIRFSNRELSPLWGGSLRFALAAALLLAVMVVLRLAFPRGRALGGSPLYGLFNFAGSFGLIYYGLVQVHAGLGQILLALVPLATLLLAVLWRQERLGAAAVIGTLFALVGVAAISRSPLQNAVPLLSVLAVVGGAICFAQALGLVRRFPRVHPVSMNAVGMTAGALCCSLRHSLRTNRSCSHTALRLGRPWPTSGWSARWSCSCSTWSFSGTGRRHGRPTGSSSSRSSPSCSQPGSTMSRSASD
jgi:drug/metabolite transporter (DMT)-like permease